MADPVALIQLVSEQTMQNVVPVLAIKPARLIHLYTPSTASRTCDITKALGLAQTVPAETILHPLAVMPTIVETAAATAEAIRSARAAGERPLVNLTGGTKLMSIGAFDAARTEGAASVYVDTGRQQFIDGGTGEPIESVLGPDLTFTPIKKRLKVNVIAVANGLERVTSTKKWSKYVALARHLLNTPRDEDSCWRAMREGVVGPTGEPRTWTGWIDLSRTPFDLPDSVAQHAAAAGLVEAIGKQWRLPTLDEKALRQAAAREQQQQRKLNGALPKDQRVNVTNEVRNLRQELASLIADVQLSLNLLSGSWLEVALADVAKESGHFEDLHWSARTGGRGWGEEEEQDLIAVQGAQLALFSCKRGGARAKLPSEMEIIQTRARFVGGALTRRYLCVGRMTPDAALRRALQRRAAELGIRLITAQMLRERVPFWEAPSEA